MSDGQTFRWSVVLEYPGEYRGSSKHTGIGRKGRNNREYVGYTLPIRGRGFLGLCEGFPEIHTTQSINTESNETIIIFISAVCIKYILVFFLTMDWTQNS